MHYIIIVIERYINVYNVILYYEIMNEIPIRYYRISQLLLFDVTIVDFQNYDTA